MRSILANQYTYSISLPHFHTNTYAHNLLAHAPTLSVTQLDSQLQARSVLLWISFTHSRLHPALFLENEDCA